MKKVTIDRVIRLSDDRMNYEGIGWVRGSGRRDTSEFSDEGEWNFRETFLQNECMLLFRPLIPKGIFLHQSAGNID